MRGRCDGAVFAEFEMGRGEKVGMAEFGLWSFGSGGLCFSRHLTPVTCHALGRLGSVKGLLDFGFARHAQIN